MKKYIVSLMFVLFVQQLSAQDIIVKKNGDELNAIVTEISADLIKYKKYENPEGPTYSIKKSEVFMIRYENGTKDVFAAEQQDQADATTSSSGQATTSDDLPLPGSSFSINPLGLLQFGPIFQYEAKIGERVYLAPHFRYAFAGVATHLFWTGFEEDSELSAGSAGVGLGLKGFAEPAGDTWYYGGIVDLSWATARYDISEADATEEKATNLAVLSNFGYRWRSQSGTYINLGLLAGLAFPLKDEERYINGGELVATYDELFFFGMLELSFGWDF